MPATEKLPRLGSRIVVSMRTAVVLPAPFGTEDAEHLAGLDRDGQIVDGDERSEELCDPMRLDDRRHATTHPPRWLDRRGYRLKMNGG